MVNESAFTVDELQVTVHPDEQALGAATAELLATGIAEALDRRGSARIILATGISQFPMTDALAEREIDWSRVTVFHMDEYVGIPADHPASFRRWMTERIVDRFAPTAMHVIEGDTADAAAECRRYEALLRAAPIDVTCMGIGENGHLAFNEPGETDFDDQQWARVISLDDKSRQQQVGEGHFAGLDDVPTHAITLTVPALLSASRVIVAAPEARKADAVRTALTGTISTACPASILRTVAHASLHLDPASAAKINF
ncbi:glucosamine-6-phosphate deaminase [Propionibacteriaceae bacterium Y1685]